MRPLSLKDATPEQLAEAVEENFIRHMGWVQERLPGMRVASDEHLTLIDSGLPTDTFNILCRARLSENTIPEQIERAVGHFRSVDRPFSWWVGPLDHPTSLGQALEEAGLVLSESEAAMAADLNALAPSATNPYGLRIERAWTPEQIRDFAAVVAANWSPPDPAVLQFYEVATPLLVSPECPLWLYVCYMDDVPAGSCEMTVGERVVGLYNVCTLESHRRRGIAGALVMRCLQDARDEGWQTAVLQASEGGQRVYARLGFQVIGRYSEYGLPKG